MPEGAPGSESPKPAPETTKILSLEELSDVGRFQFTVEVLDLPEIQGKIKLKTLSVDERDALPDLVAPDGTPDSSTEKLAAYFAACVCDPKVTKEQAEEFLGKWPAVALDAVLTKFAQMAGATEKEKKAAAGAFPGSG